MNFLDDNKDDRKHAIWKIKRHRVVASWAAEPKRLSNAGCWSETQAVCLHKCNSWRSNSRLDNWLHCSRTATHIDYIRSCHLPKLFSWSPALPSTSFFSKEKSISAPIRFQNREGHELVHHASDEACHTAPWVPCRPIPPHHPQQLVHSPCTTPLGSSFSGGAPIWQRAQPALPHLLQQWTILLAAEGGGKGQAKFLSGLEHTWWVGQLVRSVWDGAAQRNSYERRQTDPCPSLF